MSSLEQFFLNVKPACNKFLKSANKNNLNEFENVIRNYEISELDTMQQYILVPLILKLDVLHDGQESTIKDQLIDCISYIISKVHLKDLNALKTILIIIIKQIYNFETGLIKKNLSEEIKLSVIKCIIISLKKSTFDVLEKFYKTDDSEIIGNICILCVDLITKEKYGKLRLTAIECLMQIFYVDDTSNFDDVVLRSDVADATFLFLPKIIQTLFKVAIGDDKQAEKLISISIKALGRILCLIYEDYDKNENHNKFHVTDFTTLLKEKNKLLADETNNGNDDDDDDDDILGSNRSKFLRNNEKNFKKLKLAGRNKLWLSASSRKLKSVLNSISILRAHSSDIVRMEYAIMCCNLCEKCSENLKENFLIFFETIIALSQDFNNDIKQKCLKTIKRLKESNLENIFNENIEYLFENCITRLPRIIQRSDEMEQLKEFLFLKGLLEILSDNYLKTLIISPGNLEKLCMSLILALTMKLDTTLLIDEYSLRDITKNLDNNSRHKQMPWRRFKYCDSIKIIQLIEDIHKILAQSSIVSIIFDHLMELLLKNLQINNEIILCLILLLGSHDEFRMENLDNFELIDLVLDELLNDKHWNLELKATQKTFSSDMNTKWFVDKTPGLYESAVEIKVNDMELNNAEEDFDRDIITIYDAEFNVLHTCLVLDAIGNFSLSLKNQLNFYMCKILYKILAKAGNSNYMVFRAGNYSLNCLKISLKFQSVNELIQEYSDYILFSINNFLKQDENCQIALNTLNAIFQYNILKEKSQIYNIVLLLIDEISKPYHVSYYSSYLNIFCIFLQYLQNQLKMNNFNNENEFNTDNVLMNTSQNIYEMLFETFNRNVQKIEKLPMVMENDIQQEDNNLCNENNRNEQNDDEIQDNIDLPQHIKIVIKILREILKFINFKEKTCKILSIECLTVGITILKDYENELLPIVHLIWYPFVEDFKDNDLIVLNRCFDLLTVLCLYAKDFLLQRTLKDIIPFLNKFLSDSSKTNLQKECNLTQTQVHKLQTKLLRNYADIIINLGINEKELDNISDIVLLYLSKSQIKSLQEYSVKYFIKISNYNKSLIRVKLIHYIYNCEFEQNVKLIFKNIIR